MPQPPARPVSSSDLHAGSSSDSSAAQHASSSSLPCPTDALAASSSSGPAPPTARPRARSIFFFRFSGSGWLLAFQAGVGKWCQEHMDLKHTQLRFGGESGGSLVG